MFKQKFMMSGAALAVAFSGVSATYNDELPASFSALTGYVVQQVGDVTSAAASTAFITNWYQSSSSKFVWNETAAVPHAGTNYYTAKQIVAPNVSGLSSDTNWVFAGSRLVLGDNASIVPMSTGYNHPVITNLFMLGGSRFLWYNPKNAFSGTCHVRRSSASKPVYITASQTINQDFDMDVDGDADQHVIVRATTNGGVAKSATFNFNGDWSAYRGTILVTNTCPVSSNCYTRLYVTGPSFPADVTIATNCTFGVTAGSIAVRSLTLQTRKPVVVPDGATLTIGDLAAEDEVTITLEGTASKIIVTNSFTVAEGRHLRINLPDGAFDATAGEAQSLSLVEFAEEVDTTAISLDTFIIVGGVKSANGLPTTWPELKREGGKTTLTFNRRAVVTYTGADSPSWSAGKGCLWYDLKDKAGTSFYWSDEATIHDSADYMIAKKCGTTTEIDLPDTDENGYTFAGSSLTLALKGLLLKNRSTDYAEGKCSGIVDFKNLRIAENASFRAWNSKLPTVDGVQMQRIRGAVTIADGKTLTSTPYNSKCMRFEGEVTGSGSVKVSSINSATSSEGANQGSTELSALNTNFMGRVYFDHPYKTVTLKSKEVVTVPNVKVFARLFARDGRNLGGPLASFDYDSLWLEHYGCLQPRNSLTLGQENRGVYVSDVGQMMLTNGVTLTIANPLTLAGRLILRNDATTASSALQGGTLALGGPLRFAANDTLADVGTPTAENNVIIASNVCVQALATNSFDGAALTLFGKAAIVVDPFAMGDLAAYGLVNTRENGAIAADDGDDGTASDPISVRVIPSHNLTAQTYTAAICTVPTDTVLTEASFAVAHVSGYATKVASETTEAGKTFRLTLERRGSVLFFR